MNLVAKKTLIALLAAILLFAFFSLPVAKSLVAIWTDDTSFYHGFLVLPLFFLGCFLKAEIFDVYPVRFEPLCVPMIAVTTALMMIMFFAGINIVTHFLFVLTIILIVVAATGRHIVFNNMGLVFFLLFLSPSTSLFSPSLSLKWRSCC